MPDPDKVRHQIDRHRHGGHCQSCRPYTPYGPLCYPDRHHGWTALITDVGWAFTSAPSTDARDHPWDGGHTPLRWRLLVHYRDAGTKWADIGRLFGISDAAAHAAYGRWKHRICCPITDTKAA